MEWPLEAEREFWRSACAPGTSVHSLWWFARIAWGSEFYFKRSGKTRWLVSRVHKPFLEWYVRHVTKWMKDRRQGIIGRLYLLVILPRNVGKTHLITKIAGLWLHLWDANLSLYIGSETHRKAQTFLGSIKSVLEGDDDNAWFTWLYGNFRHTKRAWNNEEVRTAFRTVMAIQEPTFGTYGLDMGITGMHPDVVEYDDPHSLETITEKSLQDARDAYDATHPALRTDSLFVGNMTRYAENDAAGHILAQEGIASWSGIPNPDPRYANKPMNGRVHVYFLQGRDGRFKSDEHPKGIPVFPEVWDKVGMDAYELKDPVNFAAQIQNTPTLGEHMPLEWAQLDRMEVSRDDLPAVDHAVILLDTAFKDEERQARGDYNVIVGALQGLRDDGKYFIDKVIRNQHDRSEQYISKLVAYMMSLRARGYRIKCICDEVESGGKRGSFKQLLQISLNQAGFRIGPDSIKQFNRSVKKAIRLRKAAAYWVEGYVKIIKGIENIDQLKYEMVNLDKGQNDDIADALTMLWEDEVWKRPQPARTPTEGLTPIQPGDEVLRPGLLQLSSQDREERVRQYLHPGSAGEGEYRPDDPV